MKYLLNRKLFELFDKKVRNYSLLKINFKILI
jgi:hypothetical protein